MLSFHEEFPLNAGRLAQAELVWRQVLKRDPGHGETLKALAVVLWETKQFDAAWIAVQDCDAHNVALSREFLETLERDSGRTR